MKSLSSCWAEVLLECAARGQVTVPIRPQPRHRGLARDHGRHRHGLASERPRGLERLRTFERVLNDVQHEAEVHDVGGFAGPLWCVVRIPAECLEPVRGQSGDIVTLPAPVVEHGPAAGNGAMRHHQLHRLRQVAPGDRRLVPGHVDRLDRPRHEPVAVDLQPRGMEACAPRIASPDAGGVFKEAVVFG